VVIGKAGVVYVVGDVFRPTGVLMENDRMTVLQAIALAGGTTRTAKLNGAKILRHTPNGVVETPIQLKKILQAKKTDESLYADDILFIPGSASKTAAYRAADAIAQAGSLSLVALRP
jgi:polysaccharide export outer membrane protein